MARGRCYTSTPAYCPMSSRRRSPSTRVFALLPDWPGAVLDRSRIATPGHDGASAGSFRACHESRSSVPTTHLCQPRPCGNGVTWTQPLGATGTRRSPRRSCTVRSLWERQRGFASGRGCVCASGWSRWNTSDSSRTRRESPAPAWGTVTVLQPTDTGVRFRNTIYFDGPLAGLWATLTRKRVARAIEEGQRRAAALAAVTS
jgi:hypothetical protein